jgi:hypothetical protein
VHAGDGIIAYMGKRGVRPAPYPAAAIRFVPLTRVLKPDISIRQIRMREGRAFYIDGQA